jgi:malate dehydrogenase (oxaloacetate-decarboxylating)(NADP+)
MDFKKLALEYHQFPRPGKTSIQPTKPFESQNDLSLAYTPGVAGPVEAIAKDQADAYLYTNKGNLVAVITDGSAVLGLGNVGAIAGKPVMEGKAVLFKLFADIDVFDIEVDAPSTEAFIETVANIAPTFGGINLEDIAAPKCFAIEESLKERLSIPVFHDDQHGTAVVVCAGLLNALEIQGKRLEDVNIVVQGAGSAGIATAKLLCNLGANRDHIVMVDSKGVIHSGRIDLNVYKQAFAINTPMRSVSEAMIDADVLIGLSGPNTITPDMIKRMTRRSIVFALSNPDPEIYPEQVNAISDSVIVATGRSDYPNQVNNSLVFPFIFRAALDEKISQIDQQLLTAAVKCLASLAHQPVPQKVRDIYATETLEFGPGYILPKQFDPRLGEHMINGLKQSIREKSNQS